MVEDEDTNEQAKSELKKLETLHEKLESETDKLAGDKIMMKYAPDEYWRLEHKKHIIWNIIYDLSTIEDLWDNDEALEKARNCVDAEMFETSLLFFNRCLWLSTEEEKDVIIKEKEDVLKKLSDHF